MDTSQLIYGIFVVVGITAYWWFTAGRHGSDVYRVQLKLPEGEEVGLKARILSSQKDADKALILTTKNGDSVTLDCSDDARETILTWARG